jgi:ribosomal RNA-processing protein 1
MHDSKNAISVQKLIADLAATVRTMASKDAELRASDDIPPVWLATWTTAFWETICREWASIDQWRMNKVLLLVRFFLRESFNITLTSVVTDNPGSETVSKDLTADQIQILETWPLSPRERKVPDGLRLHILDIWVDELTGQISSVEDQSVQSVEGDPETVKAALLQAAKAFMAPVERVSKEALGKPVKMRAKDALQSFQEAFPS